MEDRVYTHMVLYLIIEFTNIMLHVQQFKPKIDYGVVHMVCYINIKSCSCKHDTETDISKKDFILLLNVNKNIQKIRCS